jgi:hypothetical protein
VLSGSLEFQSGEAGLQAREKSRQRKSKKGFSPGFSRALVRKLALTNPLLPATVFPFQTVSCLPGKNSQILQSWRFLCLPLPPKTAPRCVPSPSPMAAAAVPHAAPAIRNSAPITLANKPANLPASKPAARSPRVFPAPMSRMRSQRRPWPPLLRSGPGSSQTQSRRHPRLSRPNLGAVHQPRREGIHQRLRARGLAQDHPLLLHPAFERGRAIAAEA